MKEILFFALIGVSLIGSLLIGRKEVRADKKPVKAILKAIAINVMILGLGSLWWFLTEDDGFSQGIGVMIYLGSIVGISVINVCLIYIWYVSEKR